MMDKITDWDYRVMAQTEFGGMYLTIRRVYYSQDGSPISYGDHAVTIDGNSIDEIKRTLDRMKECTEKPILWADDDKFPNEYKPIV
jgi:hypothetical protein